MLFEILYSVSYYHFMFPGGSDDKESACSVGDPDLTPWLEDPLEEGMATHSSILAWRIPWTEEPGRLWPIYRVEKSRKQLSD